MNIILAILDGTGITVDCNIQLWNRHILSDTFGNMLVRSHILLAELLCILYKAEHNTTAASHVLSSVT
jgi:hypothetical protein